MRHRSFNLRWPVGAPQSLIPSPDNHMINGTKLLNVAGMTRGRRDGILKSEKMRHVVKIGPMHLKGVWYVKREMRERRFFGVRRLTLAPRQDSL